ncbi:MAG: PAS domain S-box protein [Verrucomicrobiae bacterium]
MVLVLIPVLMALVGGWYYRAELEEISREKHRALSAIGELKAGQIQQWRKERLTEGKRAGDDLLTRRAVEKFLTAPADPALQDELRECLRLEVTEFANMLLFDLNGNILFNAGSTKWLVPATTREASRAAITKPEAVMSDFFPSSTGAVHIDVAVAVRDDEGRPLAVLVLRTHAIDHLFSLLEFWPLESCSTETVLVQREGEEVVFVNPMRSDVTAPMERRIPLARATVPAVQAALGKEGRFEGRDYRNIPVLTDLRRIPGTSWFLVTKVDREEIVADARYRAGVMSLIIGLLLLLATLVVINHYRRQQAGNFRALIHGERKQAEARKNALEEQAFSNTLIESIPGTFYMLDENGLYVRWNAYQRDEIVGKDERIATTNAIATIHPDDRELISSKIANVLKNGEPETVVARVLLRGGPAFRWLVMTGRQMAVNGRPFLLGIGIDITERKQAEEELKRKFEELERFNQMTTGRELRMIELKQEINAMLKSAGQPEKYRISEA